MWRLLKVARAPQLALMTTDDMIFAKSAHQGSPGYAALRDLEVLYKESRGLLGAILGDVRPLLIKANIYNFK
jgi:hypothetical protein